jgi:Acyl-CoA carboxylase epsilon subunit
VNEPLLRVVNADATPEEVAAIVAVFGALSAPVPAPPAPSSSEWAARHRGLRRSYPQGPNAWRNSALPR